MIYLNGVELKFKEFPNGETLVDGTQILNIFNVAGAKNIIKFKYQNDSDLIKLMFVKKFLDERNASTHLIITYMPYSRMDRREGNSVFTLKYVAEFINNLHFDSVTIVEPHSDVVPALIDNCQEYYVTSDLLMIAVDRYKFDKDRDYLFFPDSGSAKRYGKVKGYKQLIGHKERDFETGRINRLDILGQVDTNNFKVIIVDDLSSRGGTFVLSAEKLKEIGAKEIYLVVGHCENTILEGEIPNSDLIDEVLTTDSIFTGSHPKIFVKNI